MGLGPEVTDRDAAVSGLLGAAAALAVAELVAGVSGAAVPSLTTSVGQMFIPLVPAWLKDIAIAAFGLADKPVFVAGVVVVTLLLGRWVGRRARTDVVVPTVVFVAFAVFGAVAALRQPGAAAGPVIGVSLLAAVTGMGVLAWLLSLAGRAATAATAAVPVSSAVPGDTAVGRRPFLVGAGAVGAAAAGAAAVGYSVRRSRLREIVATADVDVDVASSTADLAEPVGATNALDVEGLTPIVVPNEDFYRIDTALGTPFVDASTWSLRISGMVDTPIELSYDDLRAGDVVERYVTLSCVSNEVGGGLVGNALWRGVLLGPLLERAGVQQGAGQVVGRSVDGWSAGFPLDAAFDRDSMIAFAMNGEPLPAAHGFPARLVVPGLYGYVSATKWLQEIELTTWEGFDGYWIPRGWSKEGPIKTQSRIDVPADGVRIEQDGPTVVAGVAWAPDRGIQRVEVRRRDDAATDGGPWTQAELSEPLADTAWVQWRAELDLPSGASFLQVRATDSDGETQTDELADPAPDGATGWHTVRVFT